MFPTPTIAPPQNDISIVTNTPHFQLSWSVQSRNYITTNTFFASNAPSDSESHNLKRLDNNLHKLARIANYADNWNGYGAKPFPPALIEKARTLITSLQLQPELFPTANDSLQIEWEKSNGEYLEIQVTLSDRWEVFQMTLEGKISEAVIPADTTTVNDLVNKFYSDDF